MLDDSIGPGFVGIDHSKVPLLISKADNRPSNVETNRSLKMENVSLSIPFYYHDTVTQIDTFY